MSSNLRSHTKDIDRVAGGLKASIHNPKVSDEAKQQAEEKLRTLEKSSASNVAGNKPHKPSEDNIMRGYKAAIHNPRVSDEAKGHAESILKEHDAL